MQHDDNNNNNNKYRYSRCCVLEIVATCKIKFSSFDLNELIVRGKQNQCEMERVQLKAMKRRVNTECKLT